jgi:hypothetical protein
MWLDIVVVNANRSRAERVEKEGQGKALPAADLQNVSVSDRNPTVLFERPRNSAEDLIVSGRKLAIFSVVVKQFEVAGQSAAVVPRTVRTAQNL